MEAGIKESLSSNPLISVIVPVFNIRDYLPECLLSILGQTYQNMEIIIVDDGSDDGTGPVADEFAEKYHEKIRVFHKENTGVMDSRIYGTRQARGEWIAFVDGDDSIEPSMYERLMANAQKYGADISHCGYQTVVNKGERIHFFYNTGKLIIQSHDQGINDLISGQFVEPSVCNKLYKAGLFRKVYGSELLDPGIRYTEDLLMNYILFCGAAASVYDDFCPYHYNVRKTSASRSGVSLHRILDPVRVYELILGDGENQYNSIIIKRYLSSLINAFYSSYEYEKHSIHTKNLRVKLLQHKRQWNLLRRAEQVKLQMLLCCPEGYHSLYRLYNRFLRKKRYE